MVYAKMVVNGLIASPTTRSHPFQAFPELLLLDRARILWAHMEFNCIVDRIAVLTQATAFISAHPSDERRSALSSLSLWLVEDKFPDLDTEEAASFFVGESDHAQIAGVIRKGVVKEDPVRKLM